MVKYSLKNLNKMDKVAPEPIHELHLGGDFSSLTLSDISPKKRAKTPRKILHFSDGTLEEYSTDEEEEEIRLKSAIQKPKVDPKSLTWGPWMGHVAKSTGSSLLSACDYVGEGLANILGITSQKYFYEIEDYKRYLKEQDDEKKEQEAQMSGWSSNAHESQSLSLDKDFNMGQDFSGEPIVFTRDPKRDENQDEEKY